MGLFSRFKKTESTSKNKRSAELTVLKNEKLTADSCRLSFDVPAELQASFQFTPGQYLNLHCVINNETVVRSYSICSGINEPFWVNKLALLEKPIKHLPYNSLKCLRALILKMV